MTSPRDGTTRLRHGLNPLATLSIPGLSNHIGSPMSAISMASPHHQSTQSSTSTIQPYNPQEWASSFVQPSDRHLQNASAEGSLPLRSSPPNANQIQAAAPPLPPPPPPSAPPPPYSQARTQQPRPTSMIFDQRQVQLMMQNQPPPRLSTQTPHRPAQEPQNHRAFPPPPGTSGRASSRERLFGLSLGRRKDRDVLTSSPEPIQPKPASSRQAVGPSLLRQPEAERVASVSNIASPQLVPPASRRAASTSAIDHPNSAHSRSASQTRWEPGMPVPPPPPRPSGSGSRSSSVQGMDRNTVPIISPPTRRRPPSGVASLGPVPPTPANWVEGAAQPAHTDGPDQAASTPPPPPPPIPAKGRCPSLSIDVALADDCDQPAEPPSGPSSRPSGFDRIRPTRHDKTIIQRRTESRSQQHHATGPVETPIEPRPIADIMVPTNPAQMLALPKSAPQNGGPRVRAELPLTSESASFDPRNSTPKAPDSAKMKSRVVETPPFSPSAAKSYGKSSSSPAIVPKSLPTPPLVARSESRPRSEAAQPTPTGFVILPLSKEVVMKQDADEFATGSIERFRAFAMMESTAATDAERVRLFADFIVNESIIRRERYQTAIGAMGSEIFDLTRNLFRPMAQLRRPSNVSQEGWASETGDANHAQATPRGDGSSSSAPASAQLPPSPGQGFGASWGTSGYKPSLSPILSMSVSDNFENGSSRGRAPSRWWEVDDEVAQSQAGLERSRRELKYMGVPKEQWLEAEDNVTYGSAGEQSSASDYRPEKIGWHELSEAAQTPQMAPQTPAASSSSPATSRQGLLDVSRLVTLPPPYPRHHPAVNNKHPELSSIRNSVRALSKLDEIDETKERFAAASAQRRQEFQKAAVDGRQAMRANLQGKICSGHLNYADAAEIEQNFNKQEKDKKKELEKTEYEHFQNQVVLPLNNVLTERISRATELFDRLVRHLFDNGEMDADMPQEEGDDRPELLEKLTLLKWVFEQRETLHRAIYDLLSDRNDRYCEVVLTPYQLSGNTEKLKSAKEFFAEDAARREHAFAKEVLGRAREFRAVMEEAVARGVELQLSAFWDIAPLLRRLLEKIPSDLGDFGIQIPAAEFDENPSYHEHPLQYLYSLLLHAEKSSYQFIEAHTNQLCLLHEVKEAVVNAEARALATMGPESDGTRRRVVDRETEAQQMKEVESARLTEDLKEKVRIVQDQWNSALGEAMTSVKERTGEWLLSTGGWDETLEDGGVGVA